MKVVVEGTEEWGSTTYGALFETIMADVGKSVLIDTAVLVLKPDVPLFVFSVKLKSEPVSKTVADVASIREENGEVHISITEERYAPEILAQVWKKYGRSNVDQQTRFDMDVHHADSKIIGDMVISSGEDVKRDVIGAVWRAMPEGIKARHSFTDGTVITIMATEEIIRAEMLDEALKVHKRTMEMEASEDV
jgi:putative methanogenesis marker protein 17